MDPPSRLRPVTAWSVSMDLPGAGDTVVRERGSPGPRMTPPALASALGQPRVRHCGALQRRGPRPPSRPSTASPLFPGTPEEHPAPGSALRSERGGAGGHQGRAGEMRVAPATPGRTGSAAVVGGVAWPPSSVRHLSERAGVRRGVVTLRTPIWTGFPPAPDAGREKSRLNWAGGLRRPRPAPCAPLGPAGHGSPTWPFVFPPEQMCCDPLVFFVLSSLQEPPPC
nr:translation initiation factor IF-2-like isoform X2 [Equus asinus]